MEQEYDQEQEQPISKTRRKKEMLALQDLGQQLVNLSIEQLGQLELPDTLRDAILEAKKMNKFGAIRRQMQYIGKLMREVDAAPIQAQLDVWNGISKEHTAWLHRLERWRERLLQDDAALGELVAAHPQADIQQLRNLIRNAQRESAAGKPPKSYRALFQELRELMPYEQAAAPANDAE